MFKKAKKPAETGNKTMESTSNEVPQHIGIILDGNRRFAKRLMAKPWKGHEWGAQKLEHVFEWCQEYKIKELTLYVLSVENFNRDKEEFKYLMNVFRNEFAREINDERLMTKGVKINFIGRLWMLPKDIQEQLQQLMDKTRHNTSYTVNFAMAYGGRAEVIDAVKKIAVGVKTGTLDVEAINEETFADHLYMKDEPDLIIRTGGEKRLSNFLMWQNSYSELIFLDLLWPEFEKKDFIQCLEDYKQRQRRFGK
ncbi:MAG: polyprenyl diphosphate synthase [Nanoarchaeota archaeon]|nr:polyprenyl diphosphate synthase [Nanoarchaeota archaeon]